MKGKCLRTLPLPGIQIDDLYWNRYTNLIPEVVIPYQWGILNDAAADAPPSHCLQNLRIAAGESTGVRQGTVFLDTDVAKWLEAVAYSLAARPDARLEETADGVIALLGRAQCADGYLNTYYMLVEKDKRWTNLVEGHELYCAGHLMEAAVAYYEATGKSALIDIACRFADLICEVFGPGKDQLHGYSGHPEIELALIRLYHATGKEAYLALSKYFVDIRGASPNYFLQEMQKPGFRQIHPEFSGYDPRYSQSHLPVRQQDTAEGHAVRAAYLYCAMADLAELYSDDALLLQCKALWSSMVDKRMYITGSIGSSGFWERFTVDYDLPNDINYSETCASIGLARFGLRMARITRDASYIDTVERALYNTVRAGISMQGDRYFYVNPLEVWPEICMEKTARAHVKPVRQKWFDVACCPTNVARTLTALGQYIYFAGESELFINLFVGNTTKATLSGKNVTMVTQTDYPRSGNVSITIDADNAPFCLYMRVPAFAEDYKVLLNGEPAAGCIKNGYYRLDRVWNTRDTIAVSFSIRPQIVYANPLVRANVGKVALVRGPEVYCFEEADNGAGLAALYINENAALEEVWDSTLFGGTMRIKCKGAKLIAPALVSSFSADVKPHMQNTELSAIPYGSWGNRESGEMIVWIHARL